MLPKDPFKLIFYSYLRKQGYNLKDLLNDEIDLITSEASEYFPENPKPGDIFNYYSMLYQTEFLFVFEQDWDFVDRNLL